MKTNIQRPRRRIASALDRSKRTLVLILLKRSDFLLSGLAGALLLATAYYVLLLQGSRFDMLIENIKIEPVYFAALKILFPTTLLLFGLNFGLTTILFRAGAGLKSLGGSLVGGLFGGFGVGCPLCGAFLLSLIGVTAGLAALPFAGLEFWSGSAIVMTLTLQSALTRLDQSTCDPRAATSACWRLPANSNRMNIIFALMSLGLAVSLAWMFHQYG